MKIFRRKREFDKLIAGIRDPDDIAAQLERAAMPLEDPVAEAFRRRGEHFASTDAPDDLPLYMAMATTEHLDELRSQGVIVDEVDDGAALMMSTIAGFPQV